MCDGGPAAPKMVVVGSSTSRLGLPEMPTPGVWSVSVGVRRYPLDRRRVYSIGSAKGSDIQVPDLVGVTEIRHVKHGGLWLVAPSCEEWEIDGKLLVAHPESGVLINDSETCVYSRRSGVELVFHKTTTSLKAALSSTADTSDEVTRQNTAVNSKRVKTPGSNGKPRKIKRAKGGVVRFSCDFD